MLYYAKELNMYYNFAEDRTLDRTALKAELNVSFPVGAEHVTDEWHLIHQDNAVSPLEVPFGKKSRQDGYEMVDGLCQARFVFEDLPLDTLRVNIRREAEDQFTATARSYVAFYPEEEQATFPQQLAEARAYLDDIGAAVPFLSAIAAARNLSVVTVAQGVIENANEYAQRMGKLVGAYRDICRAIDEAVSVEDLRKVKETILPSLM